MALQDRYYLRVKAVEPHTDGFAKLDTEYWYGLWDTVARTYSNQLMLRHQDVLLSYDELNGIAVNPANDTTAKKRQALFDLLRVKVAAWQVDKSDEAFKDVNAWMPGTWPGTAEDIVLR